MPDTDLDEAERYARTAVANNLHRTPPEFLARVMAEYDRRAQEIEQLRGHILDIDAHATGDGDIPDDPGYTGLYLVTAGALHRALGKIGHTAPSCQAEAERDAARAQVSRVRALAHGWSELADEAESPTAQAHMQGYEIWEAVGEASAYRHAVRGVLAALDEQETRHA